MGRDPSPILSFRGNRTMKEKQDLHSVFESLRPTLNLSRTDLRELQNIQQPRIPSTPNILPAIHRLIHARLLCKDEVGGVEPDLDVTYKEHEN